MMVLPEPVRFWIDHPHRGRGKQGPDFAELVIGPATAGRTRWLIRAALAKMRGAVVSNKMGRMS